MGTGGAGLVGVSDGEGAPLGAGDSHSGSEFWEYAMREEERNREAREGRIGEEDSCSRCLPPLALSALSGSTGRRLPPNSRQRFSIVLRCVV